MVGQNTNIVNSHGVWNFVPSFGADCCSFADRKWEWGWWLKMVASEQMLSHHKPLRRDMDKIWGWPQLPLQEVWACWCELLSYLEQENAFLDQLEQKLDETDSLQGGAEELQEALDVSPGELRPESREIFCFLEIWFTMKWCSFNLRWPCTE